MRSVLRVDDTTEVSIDDARSFNHFLRVTAGPARLDLSLATASALHDLLNDYFGPPEPACSMTEDEPDTVDVFNAATVEPHVLRAVRSEGTAA